MTLSETGSSDETTAPAERPSGRPFRLAQAASLRGGVLVLGSALVWQFSNFAFNSTAAHILGPASYGSLAAVVALLYVASPLLISVQTLVSRTTTTLVGRGEWAQVSGLLRRYRVRAAGAGALVAGGLAGASGLVARFLHIGSGAPIAVIGVALGLSITTHLQRGVFQGSLRFGRYAISALTEGIGKIAGTAVLLLVVARSVEAATGAVAVSAAAALAVNLCLLGFLPAPAPVPRARTEVGHRYSAATVASLVLLAALLSLDVVAARRYLPAHTAGLFAAVSVSGKIVFYATSALTVFLFPVFSQHHEQGRSSRAPLLLALALISACSVALVVAYFVAPQLVVVPLFGHRYQTAGHYLGWMGLAAGGYATAYLSAMYLLSHKRLVGAVVLTLAVLAQLSLLYSLHTTIWEFVLVDLGVFSVAGLTLCALALRPSPVPVPLPQSA